MLTSEEINQLLTDLESDRVERTTSITDTDKFSRAICAFANDMANHGKPGVLLIGADDNGDVANIPITDKLLKELGSLRDQGNILPLPAMTVYKAETSHGAIAVIEVLPSDLPPVRYKGRTCIRVGPRRAIANEQEERILTERRSMLVTTFDIHPVPESSIESLSVHLFEEYRAQALAPDVIEENHRTTEQALASLRFFDLRRHKATVAGILLFATDPLYFLPGAYVQFLKFPGKTTEDTPEDQTTISGDLASMVRTMYDKIKSYNHVGMKPGSSLQDRLLPDYPEWALRELLHNALIHRDYAATSPIRFYWFSDRIEIQNPGGLYGHVTAALLRTTNSYRNPVLAEACKVLGFVNKFGHGLSRVDRLLRDNGNPELGVTPGIGFFQATVYKTTAQ